LRAPFLFVAYPTCLHAPHAKWAHRRGEVAGIRIAHRRETAAPPTGVRSGKLTFLNFLFAPMSRFLQ